MLPCVAQTGVVSPVGGDQAPGITRGVSFRVRGQSSPHRATQRLSAGRARDHPVMEIVPNKALSLSLSLSLPENVFRPSTDPPLKREFTVASL